MNKSLLFSRNLALGFGIFLPLTETIRRWEQLTNINYFFNWFDDYLLGGFLIFAAWKVFKYKDEAKIFLAAAWGVAVGAIFLSTLGQLESIKNGKADPAPISTEGVLIIKTIFLLLSITGMVLCFKKNR
jgi:hypothetical protein